MSSASVVATVTQTRERWCVMGSSSGHVSVFVPVLELAMTDGECLVASSFMSHPAIPHRAVFADFALCSCDPFYLQKDFRKRYCRTITFQ